MVHRKDDQYMLQILENGVWKDVDWVTMAGASRIARGCTKKTGKSHRVMNLAAKNYVYVEAVPVA